MAVATTIFTKNAGYASTDVLDQLEQAFTWLEWHGDTQSGLVTSIVTYSGGGDTNASAIYEDVRQISTSGIGTGASFFITRNSAGDINSVYVDRPGVGYVENEIVTISSEDIGGSSNGAADLNLTLRVAGNESPIGYGGTTEFYDKDYSGSYPWAVARHTIQADKRYGDTYHTYQMRGSTTSLHLCSGNGFHPWDDTNTFNNGNYYSNRLCGERRRDVCFNLQSSSLQQYDSNSLSNLSSRGQINYDIASSDSYQLDLNVYRSGIDPKFVVFSFKQPTLSSTHLNSNSFLTWIHHNYEPNTGIWDYDSTYLGAITVIEIPSPGNTTNTKFTFRTFTGLPTYYYSSANYESRRESWSGFVNPGANTSQRNLESDWNSRSYPGGYYEPKDQRIYYRNSGLESFPISSEANFNAVIKGIPLSAQVAPVPYYIPDDFVIIDFDYASASANIQQGDTITVSGSEVYTVITGSYNQTGRTSGILFCARTL
jgi:hypothetical protein